MQSADREDAPNDKEPSLPPTSSAELELMIRKISRQTSELAAASLLKELLPRIEHVESELARLGENPDQEPRPDSNFPASALPKEGPLAPERPAEERAWERLRTSIEESEEDSDKSQFSIFDHFARLAKFEPALKIIAIATAALGTLIVGALLRAFSGV
jgi:hypothetical protein